MPSRDVSKQVIDQIKKDKIKPTSAWVFRSERAASYFVILIAFFLAAYLLSAVIYLILYVNILERNHTVNNVINDLPWQTVLLLLMLLLLVMILTRRLGTYYRLRRRIVLLVSIGAMLILSTMIYFTDIHKNANLMPQTSFYYDLSGNFFGPNKTNYIILEYVEQNENKIIADDDEGHIWQINFDQDTELYDTPYQAGDYLKVIGYKTNGEVFADLIRKISLCETKFIAPACH